MSAPETSNSVSDGISLQAWFVLLALSVGGFAIGMAEFAAMSVLPEFAAFYHVSEPRAGWAISTYALGVVVGAPLLATLGAGLSRRMLLVLLMTLFSVSNLLTALMSDFSGMLLFRFISGLPHGAYFGVAALVAASVVPFRFRTRAVSMVMMGLTVATIFGVPAAKALSQAADWRWTFVLVCALALLAAVLVAWCAPRDAAAPQGSAMRELKGLANRHLWLTLAIGTIGFGGMFAVYAYLASTLEAVTQLPTDYLPWYFAIFGIGITCGNLVGGWASDRYGLVAGGWVLLWSAASLALFPFFAGSALGVGLVVFLIGGTCALPPILQTRLMDVAGDAQTLAAALNHSAFNAANALGPFLAGLVVAAGYGWRDIGWVGVALALGGWVLWFIAWQADKSGAAHRV